MTIVKVFYTRHVYALWLLSIEMLVWLLLFFIGTMSKGRLSSWSGSASVIICSNVYRGIPLLEGQVFVPKVMQSHLWSSSCSTWTNSRQAYLQNILWVSTWWGEFCFTYPLSCSAILSLALTIRQVINYCSPAAKVASPAATVAKTLTRTTSASSSSSSTIPSSFELPSKRPRLTARRVSYICLLSCFLSIGRLVGHACIL